ncbi:MAG: DUF5658 family protein [Candidatus Woesearchaeota archaeon]
MDLSHVNYYKIFTYLLITLIILNVLDSLTTFIGVHLIDGIGEGNPVVLSFVHNVWIFIAIKVFFITFMLTCALLYLLHIHHAFPKLWENEVGVSVAALGVGFYSMVVINNMVLIVRLSL